MYRPNENECIHKKNKIASVLRMVFLLGIRDINIHFTLERVFILYMEDIMRIFLKKKIDLFYC